MAFLSFAICINAAYFRRIHNGQKYKKLQHHTVFFKGQNVLITLRNIFQKKSWFQSLIFLFLCLQCNFLFISFMPGLRQNIFICWMIKEWSWYQSFVYFDWNRCIELSSTLHCAILKSEWPKLDVVPIIFIYSFFKVSRKFLKSFVLFTWKFSAILE